MNLENQIIKRVLSGEMPSSVATMTKFHHTEIRAIVRDWCKTARPKLYKALKPKPVYGVGANGKEKMVDFEVPVKELQAYRESFRVGLLA